jgi:hypothetical protein
MAGEALCCFACGCHALFFHYITMRIAPTDQEVENMENSKQNFKKAIFSEMSGLQKWFMKKAIQVLMKLLHWYFYDNTNEKAINYTMPKQNILLLKIQLNLQVLFQMLDKK